MTEKKILPLTVTMDANLKKYIDPKTGPFFKKSLIKPTQLTTAAIEQWLKENGYWQHFLDYCAEQEMY